MNDILLKVVFAGGMGEKELPFRSNKQHKNNKKVCALVMNRWRRGQREEKNYTEIGGS